MSYQSVGAVILPLLVTVYSTEIVSPKAAEVGTVGVSEMVKLGSSISMATAVTLSVSSVSP